MIECDSCAQSASRRCTAVRRTSGEPPSADIVGVAVPAATAAPTTWAPALFIYAACRRQVAAAFIAVLDDGGDDGTDDSDDMRAKAVGIYCSRIKVLCARECTHSATRSLASVCNSFAMNFTTLHASPTANAWLHVSSASAQSVRRQCSVARAPICGDCASCS